MYMDDGFDVDVDVAVVGGGPAGLTAALYTTRLGLDTLVLDRGGGRAAMMTDTHNVIGVTEDVTGNEFLGTAREQVEEYGGEVRRGFVDDVAPIEPDDPAAGFRLDTTEGDLHARRVVLATGFSDGRPDPPLPRTGRGLHWCLHCDAYMFVDEPVFVMGTDDAAAHVAMIMLNFTDDVDLLTRGEEPQWSAETADQLEAHPVDVVDAEITGMNKDESGWLESYEFADGAVRTYRGGFPMLGSEYNADLVDSLGLDRHDDGTVAVDDDGETSVPGVYAVGDLTPGHNQIPVAMGEGADAGIAIHIDLRAFPRSAEELETEGSVGEAEVPALSEELLATAITHEGHAGGPRPGDPTPTDGTPADD
ncbi:MAG: NAD(P)/FAD-dependent oxidoreductase [Halobacteriales archaeon]